MAEPIFDDTAAIRDLQRIADLAADVRFEAINEADDVADEWSGMIYFCPDCDAAGRRIGAGRRCSRYPAGHDETGFIGTGTDASDAVRNLARAIAAL